ncbi:sulfite exporter TauE/SafE family protein [Campylobacter insulaenigrae]|uniref:Sulfite exporter TauE/SafE family protein n=1 Tax=Campylobacter insulaenigrae TaxID=260714 RepID=A0ABY3G5D6_9BACT|nr:sulfite exporter TauE/SafE family protein [Campylobacter insulaenigrae]MCR6572116.1 sulfite exporter TauE/SafE family protein [Campylobacter insulaenigrae]MCR6573686.1 sulfite exporter TauE/SafE family protein [Campylobacter insulaenigrae]MCR6576781.1 sulfite exporter TauE/SafE family protein [Campylobacter insulaenigrae]MCR6579784.1 sulfite exporter TauE/SafE family protein [Campylobacter insulaenigrae]MCR6581007.1 sulfite exporter TauE/SafE family protein [Campylobacter insulaenigrae]
MSLDFVGLISIAFLSSFGHCYGMCGGFILAYNQLTNQIKLPYFVLIFSYHISRITAYMFLGMFFGYFGSLFSFSEFAKGIMFFCIGVFTIFLAFALIFRGKLLFFLEHSFIFDYFIKKSIKKILHYKSLKGTILLGFLNGFVPCGLVYFYIAFGITSQNMLDAAFIMLLFGLSTLPSMIFLAYFSKILSEKFQKISTLISYMLILLYGIYFTYTGFMLTA